MHRKCILFLLPYRGLAEKQMIKRRPPGIKARFPGKNAAARTPRPQCCRPTSPSKRCCPTSPSKRCCPESLRLQRCRPNSPPITLPSELSSHNVAARLPSQRCCPTTLATLPPEFSLKTFLPGSKRCCPESLRLQRCRPTSPSERCCPVQKRGRRRGADVRELLISQK